MKTRTNKFVLILFVCLFSGVVSAAPVLLPATDKGYVYTGRIDFSDPAKPMLSWPGSSIKANFTGTSLTLVMADDKGKNYYDVIVDGQDRFPYVLALKKGQHEYWISNTLGSGHHRVEIYKRTEGDEGASYFIGLKLAPGATLLAPPARAKHRIEIYGDSITSGYGDGSPYNGVDGNAIDKDNYRAYGSVAARQLHAELHTISKSGIGIMISWFPFTMPDYYDQLSAVGNNDSKWDFSRWTPDVVVVNLFQNDSWIVTKPERISPSPTKAQRIAAYKRFIQTLRGHYPQAMIVCTLGSMDAVKPGSPWPGYIRSAVAQLKQQGDNRLATMMFDWTGYSQHPRAAQQRANGLKLAAFIKQTMGW